MQWNLVPWIATAGGFIAIIMALFLVVWVRRQPSGNEKMREIAAAIQEGAAGFMRAQYLTVGIFAVAIFGVLASFMGWKPATGFLYGSVLSALAGIIGMSISVRANVRTAQAASVSLARAMKVAFRGGAVTGLFVVGFGLIGVSSFLGFMLLIQDTIDYRDAVGSLVGLGFGASLVSLFARMGGGIYTKAADVGADLVGKVVAGIPEDDPRNPAVIADNVGDNVGDCAGMGADLFETYAVTSIAAMLIGTVITPVAALGGGGGVSQELLTLFPLMLGSVAILASVIGLFFVSLGKRSTNVMWALYKGLIAAAVITAGGFLFVTLYALPEGGVEILASSTPDWARDEAKSGAETWIHGLIHTLADQHGKPTDYILIKRIPLFLASLVGLGVMLLMFLITEYYTGTRYRPVKSIASASEKGAATNIIIGLAVGLEATILPALVIVAGILGAYQIAGLYGVAVAALAMLSMTGVVVALDSFGPITDNGGGIAEMAKLPPEVRKITDALDAVGDTTKAVTKGYAVGSAGLAALALFYSFKTEVKEYVEAKMHTVLQFSLEDPFVIVGLLIGGMIPFAFGALSMQAVGRAAEAVIAEVQRQFREIKGIMDGTGRPEYDKCVNIVTRAALIQMIAPALLPVITPILVMCLEFLEPGAGIRAMGGVLMGSIVTGLLLALHMTASGGAWDNAKKLIEDGHHGGKGSDAHKAAVIGDTVGDPYKDTAGPAFNPLIKILNIVALIIALILAQSLSAS